MEDIRVLTYDRLRNLVALVNAVVFFSPAELATRIKLEILATNLIKGAKRLFGVPDFRLYAISDGIGIVCARVPCRRLTPSTAC
ncbi:MAG: hypothetical protein ACHQRJ_05065 [Alphaproteobacteria bacterium]